MKLTLLEMTQNILSAMSSDEVNSISDTTESLQVAECIKTSYFNMMGRTGFTKHDGIFQLDPPLTITQPVLMYKPEHVSKIEWVKYLDNTSALTQTPFYNYVTILPLRQFIETVGTFNTFESFVDPWNFTLNGETFKLAYYTDRNPSYCAIVENYYVLFDAYDQAVDDTLQASKTMCFGSISPQWSMTNDFIPDLDENQFPLLHNEAKALAFFELKQTIHPKAEQEVKRQWSSSQKNKSTVDKPSDFDSLPSFGRIPNAGRNPNFRW